MMKKTLLELNQESMKETIMKKYQKKKRQKYDVILVLIGVGLVLLVPKSMFKSSSDDSKEQSVNVTNMQEEIKINNVEIEEEENKNTDGMEEEAPELFKVTVPDDLSLIKNRVYDDNDSTSAILDVRGYEYVYSDKKNRTINFRLEESGNFKEASLKDYLVSNIDGVSMVIMQDKEQYYCKFKVDNYLVELKTKNITLEELKIFIKSVIKEVGGE